MSWEDYTALGTLSLVVHLGFVAWIAIKGHPAGRRARWTCVGYGLFDAVLLVYLWSIIWARHLPDSWSFVFLGVALAGLHLIGCIAVAVELLATERGKNVDACFVGLLVTGTCSSCMWVLAIADAIAQI